MKTLLQQATLALALSACSIHTTQAQSCNPSGIDGNFIRSIESGETEQIPENEVLELATSLIDCLGHTDPAVRDELAYTSLAGLLRSGTLSDDSVRILKDRLLQDLTKENAEGFLHPFTSIVLAEVARVDRVSPFLSEEERLDFVRAATDYVSDVDDYRGFTDGEGWRHGIAHGADWMMQLALNPELSDDGREMIYGAIASQVQGRNGHAYIHGEPERLARPLLFAAMSGNADETAWKSRFQQWSSPAPLETWTDAYKSEADLSRLHNLKAFLRVLYINVNVSQNDALKAMQPAIIEALRGLPT